MHPWKRSNATRSAFIILVIPILILFTAEARALVYSRDLRVEAQMILNLPAYGIMDLELTVDGWVTMEWSDPIPGPDGEVIENEITGGEAINEEAYKWTLAQWSPGPSPGDTEWPVEPELPSGSYFLLMVSLELPLAVPGETFHNEIPIEVHSFVTQWPPYYETYEMDPSFPVTLFNSLGDPVGEILSWSQTHTPYYPPTAHINAPMGKYSDVLVPIENEIPFVNANANLITNVPHEVLSARFGWRLAGTEDPFVEFGFDTDGSAPGFSTVNEMGTGGGWSAW